MYELYRYSIKPGCTTLEDHAVSSIKEFEMETCEQENLCPEFIIKMENYAKLLLNIMFVEIKYTIFFSRKR